MSTEIVYLLAGAIAIIGAARKDGRWPANGAHSVTATVVLMLIASATNNTKIAPLVRAFGLALLLTTSMAAIRINTGKAPARITPADSSSATTVPVIQTGPTNPISVAAIMGPGGTALSKPTGPVSPNAFGSGGVGGSF